jgi:hypothetical protein
MQLQPLSSPKGRVYKHGNTPQKPTMLLLNAVETSDLTCNEFVSNLESTQTNVFPCSHSASGENAASPSSTHLTQLINFIELGPFWEANSCSTPQEILNPKVILFIWFLHCFLSSRHSIIPFKNNFIILPSTPWSFLQIFLRKLRMQLPAMPISSCLAWSFYE